MKYIMKTVISFIILISTFIVYGTNASAQGSPPLWHFQEFTTQPLLVPTLGETGKDLLIDNFEYLDTPSNHGWRQIEPPYPVYGYGIGYATRLKTVLDMQEGSRVMDVFRPYSAALLGTPYNKFYVVRDLMDIGGVIIDLEDADPPDTLPATDALSFKFRAPLYIEPWDIFELVVNGTTRGRYNFTIKIMPVQPSCGDTCISRGSTHEFSFPFARLIQQGSAAAPLIIEIELGRGFLDGTWHIVNIDLNTVVDQAFKNAGHSVPNDQKLSRATQLMLGGRMFRVDNILFRSHVHEKIDCPDLFEIGPRYAQIFEPYRYLILADYEGCVMQHGSINIARTVDLMMDSGAFLTDTDDIRAAWEADLAVLGIDTNYADPNSSVYGKANSILTQKMGRGTDFIIDINLPLFSDANYRIAGLISDRLRKIGHLAWNATIGGVGRSGIQTFLINPFPINPYDGMPTYIPAYYAAIDVIESTTRSLAGNSYGKPHYGPLEVWTLESALWNVGMKLWPNIAYIDYTPMVFEDLIVTIEVTNGVHNDIMTFPIAVINFPVENYPPIVQIDIDDQIFHVGQPNPVNDNKYAITFVDPDCFIFSLAQFEGIEPATSHKPGFPWNTDFRKDMDNLIFRMTLNDLPSYQFGYWQETIINPRSGLIHFIPKFEGILETTVICIDEYGAQGIGQINIFAINPGTWLNHPPIISGGPTNPVVLNAGEEYELHAPLFNVFDPDGDELYASCNIGSCGHCVDGAFIWNFQSNFPGYYDVEIFFYDIRGGYAILWFPVIVTPWWSF